MIGRRCGLGRIEALTRNGWGGFVLDFCGEWKYTNVYQTRWSLQLLHQNRTNALLHFGTICGIITLADNMMISSGRRQKLLNAIRDKRCRNVHFRELCNLVQAYGCELARTRGSHHAYKHPALKRTIIIQKPHHSPDVPPRFCRQVLKYIYQIMEYENINDDD